MTTPQFDNYSQDYDVQLNRGLAVTGESKEYYALGRMQRVAKVLSCMNTEITSVLDYGCGIGNATPLFFEILKARHVIGVDVSSESLKIAREQFGNYSVHFELIEKFTPERNLDLVFCNGVFHHIPVAERSAAVDYIRRSLKPGGLFAFWENNPWNPGTRYVMSKVPFDRDAIMLSPFSARKMLSREGFQILRTEYCFFFPRLLKPLRPLEPLLTQLPFGGQYLLLAQAE